MVSQTHSVDLEPEGASEELRLIAQSAGEAALLRILRAGEGSTILELDGIEWEVTLTRRVPPAD